MSGGACLCYSISKAQEFEWESQLKFYWWKPADNLVIKQCTGTCSKAQNIKLGDRLVVIQPSVIYDSSLEA
jgi:hypothetical protein